VATLAPIAPRLLLDGKPLSLTDKRWHIEDKLIKTADSVTIDAFLQQVQEGKRSRWPMACRPSPCRG
jgi:hypothetical protein